MAHTPKQPPWRHRRGAGAERSRSLTRYGTPIAASHRCFGTLPSALLSSAVFQGCPAHRHTCARTASPHSRAEHPLHGVCVSLLPCCRAGWVQVCCPAGCGGCHPHHTAKTGSTGLKAVVVAENWCNPTLVIGWATTGLLGFSCRFALCCGRSIVFD